MKNIIGLLLVLVSLAASAAEFDPLHREFGINIGPLGRFDGNGGGLSNLNGATALTSNSWFLATNAPAGTFNGNGLTLTNTSWNTDRGVTIASMNQNGTFTIVDTNGNTRLSIDPTLDTTVINDSNSVNKILIQNQTLYLDNPNIIGAITGSGSGLTSVNAATVATAAGSDATSFMLIGGDATGNQAVKTSTATYDPTTGTLGVTNLSVSGAASVGGDFSVAGATTLTGDTTAGNVGTATLRVTATGNTNQFAQLGPNANITNGIPGLTLPAANAVNLTNLTGASFSRGQIYGYDGTNYPIVIGTIYQKLVATNKVYFTNVSGIGSASVRIIPSGADRPVYMPTNWAWLSTNGFVLSGTNWEVYVTNKASSIGWLSIDADGTSPTNVAALFTRTP